MSAATWLAESSNSDWVDLASAVSRLWGATGRRLLLIEVARRELSARHTSQLAEGQPPPRQSGKGLRYPGRGGVIFVFQTHKA
jgi:hypothetical protein